MVHINILIAILRGSLVSLMILPSPPFCFTYCFQRPAASGTFGSLQGSDPTNLHGSSRIPEVPPGEPLQHPPFAIQVSSLQKDSWESPAAVLGESLLRVCFVLWFTLLSFCVVRLQLELVTTEDPGSVLQKRRCVGG